MNKHNPQVRYLLPIEGMRRFIWVYFAVGLAGIGLPWTRGAFIWMIPLSYLVCALLLFLADHTRNTRLWWVSACIFLAGWGLEAVGVKTGRIFGEFAFSLKMGPELFGTPLVTGLNWLLLAYMAAATAQQVSMHPRYRMFVAAILMVAYDFALEPVAAWTGMWVWRTGKAPMVNYIAWLLASLVFVSLFPLLKIRIRNRLARDLFFAQLVFLICVIAVSLIEKLVS